MGGDGVRRAIESQRENRGNARQSHSATTCLAAAVDSRLPIPGSQSPSHQRHNGKLAIDSTTP